MGPDLAHRHAGDHALNLEWMSSSRRGRQLKQAHRTPHHPAVNTQQPSNAWFNGWQRSASSRSRSCDLRLESCVFKFSSFSVLSDTILGHKNAIKTEGAKKQALT